MCHGPSRTPVPTNCNLPYEKERKGDFFIYGRLKEIAEGGAVRLRKAFANGYDHI